MLLSILRLCSHDFIIANLKNKKAVGSLIKTPFEEKKKTDPNNVFVCEGIELTFMTVILSSYLLNKMFSFSAITFSESNIS